MFGFIFFRWVDFFLEICSHIWFEINNKWMMSICLNSWAFWPYSISGICWIVAVFLECVGRTVFIGYIGSVSGIYWQWFWNILAVFLEYFGSVFKTGCIKAFDHHMNIYIGYITAFHLFFSWKFGSYNLTSNRQKKALKIGHTWSTQQCIVNISFTVLHYAYELCPLVTVQVDVHYRQVITKHIFYKSQKISKLIYTKLWVISLTKIEIIGSGLVCDDIRVVLDERLLKLWISWSHVVSFSMSLYVGHHCYTLVQLLECQQWRSVQYLGICVEKRAVYRPGVYSDLVWVGLCH